MSNRRLIPGRSAKNLPRVFHHEKPIVVPIPRRGEEYREYERSNYVPHFTPNYTCKKDWVYAYEPEIAAMYRIIGMMATEKYPKSEKKWNEPKNMRAFIKLIYHCSSRYISPYIEERNEEDEYISSKEENDMNKGWERQKGN